MQKWTNTYYTDHTYSNGRFHLNCIQTFFFCMKFFFPFHFVCSLFEMVRITWMLCICLQYQLRHRIENWNLSVWTMRQICQASRRSFCVFSAPNQIVRNPGIYMNYLGKVIRITFVFFSASVSGSNLMSNAKSRHFVETQNDQWSRYDPSNRHEMNNLVC